MSPSIFALAICKLDEVFADSHIFVLQDLQEKQSFLKLLEYATIIESEDDDELPAVVLKGFKELKKTIAQAIVAIRNSKPFSDLSLSQERFVYKTLRKIYIL